MSENTPIKAPPSGIFTASIVFHVQSLYKEIYQIGSRLPKRDKLGLHALIEKACVETLALSIEASLENKPSKAETIRKLRINIETLKHLVRAESELKIIQEKQYLFLEEKLQEISKEAVGWERYANKSSLQRELL